MGFFSDLGKLSLSNQLVSGLTGKKSKNNAAETLLFGKKVKPKGPEPFNPMNRVGASINGQMGVDQPAQKLGWTNGGYTYNNSGWNPGAQPPTPPPQAPVPTGMGPPQQGIPGPGANPQQQSWQQMIAQTLRNRPM